MMINHHLPEGKEEPLSLLTEVVDTRFQVRQTPAHSRRVHVCSLQNQGSVDDKTNASQDEHRPLGPQSSHAGHSALTLQITTV